MVFICLPAKNSLSILSNLNFRKENKSGLPYEPYKVESQSEYFQRVRDAIKEKELNIVGIDIDEEYIKSCMKTYLL